MNTHPNILQAHAFLDVDSSLTGRRWVGPSVEADRAAEALVQATALPHAVAQVLVRQEVTEAEVEAYLAPTLRDLLPDPRSLRDMERAAARLRTAVRRRERIAIFADYDVDGGASAALLITWLRHFRQAATLYVPDRIDEGYGPNAPAMADLAARHDLIICVDCGTLSFEALAAARGTDVVVLDHHLGGETLPPALAVVNPNRQDEDGSLAHLCAAAVVFLCLVEAGRQGRANGEAGPDLMAMLDLVALATVADVAPLRGVNRALVRQGLAVMARRDRAGLRALADTARLDTAPTAYHLGYVLGPRVNAGGRVGQADLGARLLACDDPAEATALAERLETFNRDRREIEENVRVAALAQAEARGLDAPLVWAAGAGWHPGVVGIVASRLKEHSGRPAIVIGLQEDGTGKGSGRSVAGVDLGSAIQQIAREGLLLAGGGHRMAAGLTVAEEALVPAMERLSELLERHGAGRTGPRDLALDGVLMPAAATLDLVETLALAGPFGAGARAPRFALPDCRIVSSRVVGGSHLKLVLGDMGGARLDAMVFGGAEGPLSALADRSGRTWHVAGRVEANTWQGRSKVQVIVEDAAPT